MYAADTNVVSELMKPAPSPRVVDWFFEHEGEIYLTSITVQELFYGVLRLPEGKRRQRLHATLAAIVLDCKDKILPFDGQCGRICASMRVLALAQGKTATIEDLMIASICQRHDVVLATLNTKDFAYLPIEVVNPFEL